MDLRLHLHPATYFFSEFCWNMATLICSVLGRLLSSYLGESLVEAESKWSLKPNYSIPGLLQKKFADPTITIISTFYPHMMAYKENNNI